MIFMPNRSILAVGLAVFLLAAPPLAARTTAADELSVHRGASVTSVTLGGAGLAVGRGATVSTRAYDPRAGAEPVRIVAGNRLWLIDAEADRLTTCALRRTTQIDRDTIRCTSRKLRRRAY